MQGDRPSKGNNFASDRGKNQNISGKTNIPDDEINNSGKSSRREKVNSVVILIVCVFALFFGYYQLTTTINNPFSFLAKGSSVSDATQVDPQQTAIDALKTQDTDSDGLSDYDETYVYKTSPYLPDSDGDGIPDGQEVKQGTDPNCPEGKTCFGSGLSASSTSSGTVPIFQSTPPAQASAQIDIKQIRAFLVQGGLTQADVDAMTDQDIMDTYKQVLAENPNLAGQIDSNGVSAPSTVTSSTGAIPVPPKTIDTSGLNLKSIDDMKNLTGSQIRELFIKNNATQTILDHSDEELKQMWLDSLSKMATSTVK